MGRMTHPLPPQLGQRSGLELAAAHECGRSRKTGELQARTSALAKGLGAAQTEPCTLGRLDGPLLVYCYAES
jgi:hypothetical protein